MMAWEGSETGAGAVLVAPTPMKEARELAGLSQVQVAEILGIGKRTVIRWEQDGARLLHAYALVGALFSRGRIEAAGSLFSILQQRAPAMARGGRRGGTPWR